MTMVGRTHDGSLGDLLRTHRRRAGLTQAELADLSGTSIAGVRDIEQGRVATPRARTLRRLAAALNLSTIEIEELLHRTPAGVDPTGVRIGILGPLTVRVDGAEVDPGSELQRVLLGLLALSPNVPVPRQRLLSRIAAAGRPATPAGLAARMSRLRRRLRPPGGAGDPVLVAVDGGYGLMVSAEQLDLLAFRALVRQARRQVSVADLPRAWESYCQAVARWRGEPLAGLTMLADDPTAVGLVRQWPAVAAEFAAVGAELGRHREVVPVLRRAAATDPLHKGVHARLMVALAGIGRQAEALEVFDRLRRRLDHGLGAVPGPELAQAHRRVLRQEVTLPAVAAPPACRTLPADIADFTGRTAELRWLRARLDRSGAGPGPVVIAIEGMAGTGKTRLAIHFAHQLLAEDRYPDQHLYADLSASAGAPPVDPAAVLASFLHLLGTPHDQVPDDLAGLTSRYRQRLHGTRTLVVLDHAVTAAQVAPLGPPGPDSLCLVTSDRSLRLPDSHRLHLDVFTHREAAELLTAVVGPERTGADPTAADQIIEACGRLPLAVGLVARRLQHRPSWTLADAAVRLADPWQRLAELVAGGRSVRAVFDRSCQALPSEVRRHLRSLGAYPGGEFALNDLGIIPAAAKRAVDRLQDAHLVAPVGENRYRLHGLVRDYLREAG